MTLFSMNNYQGYHWALAWSYHTLPYILAVSRKVVGENLSDLANYNQCMHYLLAIAGFPLSSSLDLHLNWLLTATSTIIYFLHSTLTSLLCGDLSLKKPFQTTNFASILQSFTSSQEFMGFLLHESHYSTYCST